MESWQNRISGKTLEGIIEEMTLLEKQIPLMRSRARVIGTPAEEVIFEELNAEVNRICRDYINISTSMHPNAVATKLAELQGRQRQTQFLIDGWKCAKESNRTLDTRIEFCKKLITERREQAQNRRIGNE